MRVTAATVAASPTRARRAFADIAHWLARAERNTMDLAVPTWSVAAATMMLGSYALTLYLRADLTLAQGDAIAHVYIARRVIDSVTPSFAQLGSVWLPLPHVLMLPLVWNDTLWHTGLAGSIVSMIAYAGTAAYGYRFARLLTGNGLASLIAAGLLATNPNLLYMQATAMGEALTIFFIVAASYHLAQWALDGRLPQLIYSALFVLGGTLTRYEVWWLVPMGAGIVALTSWRRHKSRSAVEGLTLAWICVASYGIALWFVYNQVIFGDALQFVHNIGSANSFAGEQAAKGALPTSGDPIASAQVYGWAVIDVLGLPLVAAGVGGFVVLLSSRLPLGVKLAALLPASLFVFEIASLSDAQSAMLSPHSSVPDFVNTRYALLLLPGVVIAASSLARLRIAGVLLLFSALIPQLAVFPTPSGTNALKAQVTAQSSRSYAESWRESNFPFLSNRPATLVEPLLNFGVTRESSREEGRWLGAHAGGGEILFSQHKYAPALVHYSGLPLSRFIYEGNRPYFDRNLKSLDSNVEWIVYRPQSPEDSLRAVVGGGHPPGFELVFEDADVQIFRRQSLAIGDASRPAGVPASAQPVDSDVSLGEVAGATPQQFYSLGCRDGVAALVTTGATLYTVRQCGQIPSDRDLLAQPVALRVHLGGDGIEINASPQKGAAVAFTTPQAWLDVRYADTGGTDGGASQAAAP